MYNVKAVKLHTKGYHRCCKGISLGLLVEFCCVEITIELSGLFNTASGPASGCLGLCWGGSFPGPAWARAWSVVSSQLSGYTCSHLGTLAGQLCLPHVASSSSRLPWPAHKPQGSGSGREEASLHKCSSSFCLVTFANIPLAPASPGVRPRGRLLAGGCARGGGNNCTRSVALADPIQSFQFVVHTHSARSVSGTFHSYWNEYSGKL